MDAVLIKIKEKTLLLFHHLNQEWLLIMSPVTQDGSTAIYEAKNKTKIFSRWESDENSDIYVEDAHQERGRQQGERAGGAPWLLKLAAHQTNED